VKVGLTSNGARGVFPNCEIGGGQLGTTIEKVVVAVDGSPGWYPAPDDTVRVNPPPECGTVAKVGETVAVDDPGANATEVGEIVAPVERSPLQAIETVRPSTTPPERARVNTAGVETSGASGPQPRAMTPGCVAATDTDTACYAPLTPIDSPEATKATAAIHSSLRVMRSQTLTRRSWFPMPRTAAREAVGSV
jgi:hypothetical protein